jgi:type I restriction enzyme S subunit
MGGWRTQPLGALLQRTETFNPTLAPDDEFLYVDVSSVSNVTYSIEATQTLKGRDAPSRARRLIRAGDVLFATIRPTLMRIAIVPPELDGQVCSTGYYVMRPGTDIESKFLFYSLFSQHFMKAMETLQKGASYPAVTDGEVRAQPLSYPPLPDQRRIVAILDEAFEGIATAKANAEKNLRNAREVFGSLLDTRLTAVLQASGSRRLGDIVDRLTNGYVGPTRDIYTEDGVPYLLARHVRDNCLTFDGRTFVSATFNEKHKKSKLRVGDVLLVQSGHIGHSAVVGPEHDGHNCHAMIVLSPVKTLLNGNFLSYFFNAPMMRRSFDQIRSGSTVPHLTCGAVKELKIPLPSVAEQENLVAELSAILLETNRLNEIAASKLAALDELKRSFLHQAFRGRL